MGLVILVDQNGNPLPTTPIGLPVLDIGEAAAAGYLTNLGPNANITVATGRSFGYIATSATTSKTVRATSYAPQGANAQRSMSSTSASDTSAGTGARTVTITYLDQTGAGPFTETVTLNGTTAVNTVSTTIAFIESLIVASAGSTNGNVGTIQLWTATAGGGSVWASIAAGDNLTYWAQHYVPNGKTCYIDEIYGSATAVNGGLSLNWLNPISGVAAVQLSPDATYRHGTTENAPRAYDVPISIPGPAIIFLNERPDSSTASTTFAGFHWHQW